MNDNEIVKALREHAEWAQENEWECPITLGDDLRKAADLIESLQAQLAESQRRERAAVHGHWKKDRDTIKCTVCGFGMFPNRYTFMNGVCVTDNKLPKYCPNCGAKMYGDAP